MSGQRVLVTGGAGFIGSHFIRGWLRAHPDDTVITLDRLTYAGSPDRLADVAAARHRLIRGDVCATEDVRQALEGCETVVHFAAETHVDRSLTDAHPFVRTNVEGTYVLLQAAQAAGVRRFLHVSTDEVYGPVLEGAADEDAPLAPRSPYAASKAAGDLLAQAFAHTWRLPVVVARPTNVYGPWQLPEKFIPLCLTNALEQRPVPVYGDGRQRRGWLFVEDCCEALARLAERGEAGQVYNVGSGHEAENLETATRLLKILDRPATLLQFVEDRPGHDRRYALNDAKLRALGWQPRMTFEQGLAATAVWYREHAAWWRPLTQALREDPYHWLNRPARPVAVPAARRVG